MEPILQPCHLKWKYPKGPPAEQVDGIIQSEDKERSLISQLPRILPLIRKENSETLHNLKILHVLMEKDWE